MTQTFNDVQLLGDQDTTQLTVQGNSTQTQPLQVWQNGSGSVLAQLTNDGRFQVGNSFGGAADALLQANYNPSGSQPISVWHAPGTVSSAGTIANPINWVFHELQLAGTAGVSGLHNALYSKLTNNNSGTTSSAELRAATFQTVNLTGTNAAPVGKLTGLRGLASNAGTAYLGTAVGVEATLTNDTAGSISQAIAFNVVAPVNAGTIGTLIGLQVPDLTQGAVNYALYTGAGTVHLGDALEVKVQPSTPSGNATSNFVKLYPKLSAGTPHLYAKDSGGTEYDLSSGGTGSVTSVGLSMPGEFSVANSPVTATGTLTVSKANQSANQVYAGPTSGGAAQPAFRGLGAADIPNLPASIITSGQLALAQGGTGADLSATGAAHSFLKQTSSGAVVTVGTISDADLPTALSGHTIDNSAIGGTTAASGIFSALKLLIGGFKGIFAHTNTADRTYTFPDKDGTVAMLSDLSSAGITQLTGDVTAGPGSGSQATTVATVGGATAANVADAVTKRHSQNTDTGTTSSTFLVDSGGTGFKLKDNSGVAEVRNAGDTAYADLHVNNLIVSGEMKEVSGTTIDLGDQFIQFNDEITVHGSNSDAGLNVKRLASDDSTRKDVILQYSESNGYWQASTPNSSGTINTFPITRKVTATIGDGSSTTITVTHNLNSKDVVVFVRDATTDAVVIADVVSHAADNLTVGFAVAPASNAYKVTVIG